MPSVLWAWETLSADQTNRIMPSYLSSFRYWEWGEVLIFGAGGNRFRRQECRRDICKSSCMSRNGDLWVHTDLGVITSLSRLSHHSIIAGDVERKTRRVYLRLQNQLWTERLILSYCVLYNFNPSGELWQFESGNTNGDDFGTIITGGSDPAYKISTKLSLLRTISVVNSPRCPRQLA